MKGLLLTELENFAAGRDSTGTGVIPAAELDRISRQLDSLNRKQMQIDRSLDSLRLHAAQLRRQELRSGLFNLVLLALLLFFFTRFVIRRKKGR